MLWTHVLYQTQGLHTDFSSRSGGCFFTSLTMCSEADRPLMLMQLMLPVFHCRAFGVMSKNHCLKQVIKTYNYVLS